MSFWRAKNLIAERLISRSRGANQKFWTSEPRHRNGFDVFAGRWASDLAEIEPTLPHAGVPLFAHDHRPRLAATGLGSEGRLDGMTVFELGPLEGAHSYQLETLGAASVLAVEANAEAFLRCLVVKNALALNKTTFLLGDCTQYLERNETRFDLIFACGILYHMADPFHLIRLMSLRTGKVFVWTAYYDPAFRFASGRPLPHRAVTYSRDGLSVQGYERVYKNRLRRDFWGGVEPRALWLTLDDIVAAFRHYGFDHVDVMETAASEGGPGVCLAARKTMAA